MDNLLGWCARASARGSTRRSLVVVERARREPAPAHRRGGGTPRRVPGGDVRQGAFPRHPRKTRRIHARGAPHATVAVARRATARLRQRRDGDAPRALEGRDGWRAAARECAFGDGEGYRDGDRNDRGVPRGTTTRASWRRRSARSKNTRRRRFSSPMRVTRRTARLPRCRDRTSIPRRREPAGGRCPGARRSGPPRPFRSTPLVSKPRGTILPSRVTRKRRRDCFSGRSSEARSRGCVGRCATALARRRRRARRTHPSTGRRAQSLRREKTPRRVSSTGRRRGRDSRVRWGRRRVPRRRREERRRSILRRRRRSSRRRESRVAAVGVGGVGADRLTRVTVRRVGRGGGGASRGADDRQGRVRHRGGGGALRRAQLRVDGRERRVSGRFADASRGRRIGGGRNRTVRDFAGCDRVSIFIDRSRSRSRRGNRRRRRRSRRSSLESRAPSVFVSRRCRRGSPALLRLDLRRHL